MAWVVMSGVAGWGGHARVWGAGCGMCCAKVPWRRRTCQACCGSLAGANRDGQCLLWTVGSALAWAALLFWLWRLQRGLACCVCCLHRCVALPRPVACLRLVNLHMQPALRVSAVGLPLAAARLKQQSPTPKGYVQAMGPQRSSRTQFAQPKTRFSTEISQRLAGHLP